MSKETSALEQVLIDTIQKATSATGEVYDAAKGVTLKAVDFASAQIPDVIHQLLAWKMAEAVVYIVASLLVIAVFFSLLRPIRAKHKKLEASGKYYDDTGYMCYYVFGTGVLLILPLISIVGHALILIKIIIAPKLYLIEYAARLLK